MTDNVLLILYLLFLKFLMKIVNDELHFITVGICQVECVDINNVF